MTIHVTMDYETRSKAPLSGPKSVGSWLYSRHASTEVMCLAWRVDYGDGDSVDWLWHPAFPELGIGEEGAVGLNKLFKLVGRDDCLMEAHNAHFEMFVWENVCAARMGWPALPDSARWRCSAAKASAHALPRKLEEACRALGTLEQKDMDGHKLMMKLARPKKDGTWAGTAEEHRRLWEYCQQDVRAECSLSVSLQDLTPLEHEIWLMDYEVNRRGVMVDVELASKAKALTDEIKARNDARFREITGLNSTGQRAAFQAWMELFAERPLRDTTGDTMLAELARGYADPDVREAVELMYRTNRTSTKKYGTMLNLADEDGRVRGAVVYCGAERTGRFAGRGIQPHNYPKGKVKDMEAACDELLDNDLEELEAMYDDVMERLSHVARGAIVAPPGREFGVSDFAAIEACVVLWYAGEEEALGLLRDGGDLYCEMAQGIYGYPVTKAGQPDERNVGKQAILGLGFGMGAPKFVATCARFGIEVDEKFANRVVKLYRTKFPNVPAFWDAQEETALAAMERPGEWLEAGRVRWGLDADGRFLRCRLPSGRDVVYPFPEVVPGRVYYFKAKAGRDDPERWFTVMNDTGEEWPHGRVLSEARKKARKSEVTLVNNETYFDRVKNSLRYKGRDTDVKTNRSTAGVTKWGWIHTYGGKLTENIVQATARDLMAEAMLRAHRSGTYDVVLSIHDEVVAEVDAWDGDQHEFDALMAETPAWAAGCPVSAEGWRGRRYRK